MKTTFLIIVALSSCLISQTPLDDFTLHNDNNMHLVDTRLFLKSAFIFNDISSFQNFESMQTKLNSLIDEKPSRKSPWLAFGLSLFYPGLGQLYNAQYGKALLMGGLGTVGLGLMMAAAMSTCFDCENNPDYVTTLGISGAILGGGMYIWSLIDAPISASSINESNGLSRIKILSNDNESFAVKLRNDVKFSAYSIRISINF